MTETVFADRIRNISLTNGVVRIELVQTTGQGEGKEVTRQLLLPASQAANIANSLNRGLNELSERLKQQQSQTEEKAEEGAPS
jgi:hypothetical protein